VLYKARPEDKYIKFQIPKKSGGVREISAPIGALKMLQRNLADLLYSCRSEISGDTHPLSHGFRKSQSIIGNANVHKRRRFVLNLDLQDFFPTFNFGRVRGFFIKDRTFFLDEKVATVIAQIACFENGLPQGSPCSPIIADMLSHILDIRLVRLAKKHRAMYSRYADDLTFSSNQKAFPTALAFSGTGPGAEWALGSELVDVIVRSGFVINPTKTRMQVRPSRQLVTGLTVNSKVNIPQDYWRSVRAMCNALFQTGSYYRPQAIDSAAEAAPEIEKIESLLPLEGMLSHIHHVKRSTELLGETHKTTKQTPGRKLYAKFLFYKYFVSPKRPLIVCEGKTDKIYLKYAIRYLSDFHPLLGEPTSTGLTMKVGFFNYMNSAHQILDLTGGSSNLQGFINRYEENLAKYKHKPLSHPIIILLDNDSGLTAGLRTDLKKRFDVDVSHTSTDAFYHLTHNLYLIKTPEAGDKGISCIEDCFDDSVKATILEGKSFNPDKPDPTKEYGKVPFAEKVVVSKADHISWKEFGPLLTRITAAIDHYTASAMATKAA
jgi:retron-type reverse transcriptase/5S rRNA maturation endonuclease (ribonuclease M5)